ncbi:CRISPR-associated protein, Cas6 family [Eubacterium ruminantium]|nr:CRISPR-associated protein, Cas6 family [Eubacterium ruminantium]
MFSQIVMELKSDEKLTYKKASTLQGVLFENIDTEYASLMHQQDRHPYSQYLLSENDKEYWVVNALTEEAYENIIKRLEDRNFNCFRIKKGDIDVSIANKRITIVEKQTLINELNTKDAERVFNLSLLTPMAFKQRGVYVSFPDLRLIYQSIMNKYSSISDNMVMMDEETLNQLVENSMITKFNIRSAIFPLEGVNITGAIGNIRIYIKGSDVLARYIRLLLKFAEFSGIGVKSGIGMGAVRIREGVIEK